MTMPVLGIVGLVLCVLWLVREWSKMDRDDDVL